MSDDVEHQVFGPRRGIVLRVEAVREGYGRPVAERVRRVIALMRRQGLECVGWEEEEREAGLLVG